VPNPRRSPRSRLPLPTRARKPPGARARLEGVVGRTVPLDPDRVPPPLGRGPQRRARAGERVEHRVPDHREHPHEPLGELVRERPAPSERGGLRRPADVGPYLTEPTVAFGSGESAPTSTGVVRRKAAQGPLAERKDELAIDRDVRVGGEEPRPEERVGSVGRFLPEDVRERNEPDPRRSDRGLRRVRPKPELPVDGTERVTDVDDEKTPRDEDPVTLLKGLREHLNHCPVGRRPELPEQGVPLRDHRVRGGGDDEMDRVAREAPKSTRVPVDEPNGPARRPAHVGSKPG